MPSDVMHTRGLRILMSLWLRRFAILNLLDLLIWVRAVAYLSVKPIKITPLAWTGVFWSSTILYQWLNRFAASDNRCPPVLDYWLSRDNGVSDQTAGDVEGRSNK